MTNIGLILGIIAALPLLTLLIVMAIGLLHKAGRALNDLGDLPPEAK